MFGWYGITSTEGEGVKSSNIGKFKMSKQGSGLVVHRAVCSEVSVRLDCIVFCALSFVYGLGILVLKGFRKVWISMLVGGGTERGVKSYKIGNDVWKEQGWVWTCRDFRSAEWYSR